MSLLQRTDAYQKADHKHPAFRPSGRRSVQLLRFGTGLSARGICGLRKVVWQRAHKVRGGEGRSHIICSCCYLRDACPRACERNVPGRIFTHRSVTDDSEVNPGRAATAAGAMTGKRLVKSLLCGYRQGLSESGTSKAKIWRSNIAGQT